MLRRHGGVIQDVGNISEEAAAKYLTLKEKK